MSDLYEKISERRRNVNNYMDMVEREAEKAEKQQEVKASEEKTEEASNEVLEEAISQAEEEKEEIPASAEASEQTVYDKYKQAFEIDQFDVKL